MSNLAAAAPVADALPESMPSAFPGFSCPFEPFTEPLANLIAAEYARGISQIFIDKNRNAIDHSAPGLCETIVPWLHGAQVDGAGWDLCFGDVYRAMHVNIEEPSLLATAVGIHLVARGLPGQWNVKLSRPVRFRWGSLLFPEATVISVQSDGRSATVKAGDPNGTAEHRLTRGDAFDWSDGDLERIPTVTRCGLRLNVLSRGALLLRDFDDLIPKALPIIDPRMVDVLNDAVGIIDTYTPIYIPWIRRALHNLFILYPRRETIESGSVEHYLGLIHLSAHAFPLPIAELLVHEAAHQHMNLLTKLGPIDDGSDTNMYYSPPVDKYRKISLIMAAYHAFANVLLFYRLCRKHGISDRRECDRQESILLPWLQKLEGPLAGNPALTEIGRALWLPLKAQVQSTA